MWQYSGDVAFVESGGSVYCLSLVDPLSRVVLLEGSSAAIWSLLPESSTDDVIAAVETSFGTEAGDVRASVSEFVERLQALGYIVEE